MEIFKFFVTMSLLVGIIYHTTYAVYGVSVILISYFREKRETPDIGLAPDCPPRFIPGKKRRNIRTERWEQRWRRI